MQDHTEQPRSTPSIPSESPRLSRRTFLAGVAGAPALGVVGKNLALAEARPAPRLMTRPDVSPGYGLAPKEARVEPTRIAEGEAAYREVSWPVRFEGEVTFDFGRKLTGRLRLDIDGPVDYAYASDPEQLRRIVGYADDKRFHYHESPSYIRCKPVGQIQVPAGSQAPVLLEAELSALRLLRLRASKPVTIRRCWLEFSPPRLPLSGGFSSDDPELDRLWHLGVYTVLLCTQNNLDAMVPVPASGNGYVIWDGARRDREVWAGDLRLASLTWLTAYENVEPVRNSLYMLWQARHIDCDEAGMIPGSGSTHQKFYEWTFWFLVNAWEYYLWTGDRDFITSLMGPNGLDKTLDWVKRRVNARGLVEATNSWMYVYDVSGEMAALAIVQAAGCDAMASLFEAGGRPELARQAREMAARVREIIPKRFFDPKFGAIRMTPVDSPKRAHYPLDANAWAVIYKLGDESMRTTCMRFLLSPDLQTPVGMRCLWPAFDDRDGKWAKYPAWHWVHNTTVWPYPNCYAALAHAVAGDMAGAMGVFKRFNRAIDRAGHSTVWEAMMPDGSLPFGPDGNTLSFAHAWGGFGAHFLQRYVLGVAPQAPGLIKVSIRPQLGPLKQAAGSVPTPRGPIRLEIEQTSAGLRGKVIVPGGISVSDVAPGLEVQS